MKKSRLWALLAVLVLVAVPLVAAGCGDDDDDDGGGGAGGADLGLIEEGQLLVGTDAPFPPFEIGTPPDITGFDVEVMDEVGQRIGLEVTYQDTAFDTIFRDLAQGKFDAVVAATTTTPERERTVDFSDPYYEAQQALLVEDGSDIQSVDDLGGATVGAQDGTTGEAYANDETDADEVRGYPEGPDAVNALRAGQVDAVIIDQPVAQDAIESLAGGLLVATEIPTGELYGIPVAQGNDALLEEINGALTEMKEDGTITDLYQSYFSTEPPNSVLEGTHEAT
jgi:polar amino acid transport system substrate-binding protein